MIDDPFTFIYLLRLFGSTNRDSFKLDIYLFSVAVIKNYKENRITFNQFDMV
jgi:hypothetical protein